MHCGWQRASAGAFHSTEKTTSSERQKQLVSSSSLRKHTPFTQDTDTPTQSVELSLRGPWYDVLTWCARQMRSMSCFARYLETISGPNVNETPLSFSPQPITSLSGSDHSKSQSRPTHSGAKIQRLNARNKSKSLDSL